MKYDLAIFDLDGTILNTLCGIRDALNFSLARYGFSGHDLETVRHLVGSGAGALLMRAVPEGTNEALIAELATDFRERYMAHMNDNTRPYPGVSALLERLSGAGMLLGCNSNKYDQGVRELCEIHFPGAFSSTAGDLPGVAKKPAPDGAFRIMEKLGVLAARTVYIGDSDTDLATAKNAGLDACWVTWGFRKRGEIDVPQDVMVFDDAHALGDYLLG